MHISQSEGSGHNLLNCYDKSALSVSIKSQSMTPYAGPNKIVANIPREHDSLDLKHAPTRRVGLPFVQFVRDRETNDHHEDYC